jgi:hypothetical protein
MPREVIGRIREMAEHGKKTLGSAASRKTCLDETMHTSQPELTDRGSVSSVFVRLFLNLSGPPNLPLSSRPDGQRQRRSIHTRLERSAPLINLLWPVCR